MKIILKLAALITMSGVASAAALTCPKLTTIKGLHNCVNLSCVIAPDGKLLRFRGECPNQNGILQSSTMAACKNQQVRNENGVLRCW